MRYKQSNRCHKTINKFNVALNRSYYDVRPRTWLQNYILYPCKIIANFEFPWVRLG